MCQVGRLAVLAFGILAVARLCVAASGRRASEKVPVGPTTGRCRCWEAAAGLAPGNAEIQYHLGAAYARVGMRTEARPALEQALREPRFDQAEEARKLLDSLR